MCFCFLQCAYYELNVPGVSCQSVELRAACNRQNELLGECLLFTEPFTSTTPTDCYTSSTAYTYQFISEWNIITSAIPCNQPPPTLNAPTQMLPTPVPPSCSSGTWCENFQAVDECGPGCLRDDSTNFVARYYFSISGAITGQIYNSVCHCLNYCGQLYSQGCVAVAVVLGYEYDTLGTTIAWCDL